MDTNGDATGGSAERDPAAEPPDPVSPSSSPAPSSPATAEPVEYGYEATAPGASSPSSSSPAPASPGNPDPADQVPAETGVRSTGAATGTAPRAVLRPVPEGFPTPPPRPARPNRRPALPTREPEQAPRRNRLIIGVVAVAVLVLALGIGGGVLALRALAPSQPAASAPAQPENGAGAPATGTVEVGAVTVREISTELGVDSIGGADAAIAPDGEFVVLTVEVTNDSGLATILNDSIVLETEDGQTHPEHREAGEAHIAETVPSGVVEVGETQQFHVVFDIPVGSAPVAAHLDLSANPEAGEGTLPLSD